MKYFSHILLIGSFSIAHLAHGQFTTTAASNSCTCNGAFVYTNPVAGLATYTLFNQDGNLVTQQTNALGIFNAVGLCPQLYVLEVQVGANTQTYVTNILSGTTNIGNATTATICTTDGTVQLNSFLVSFDAGGVWTNPAGNVISQLINAAVAQEGLYVYTMMIGGCEVSTGVYLHVLENANAGLSTTYVICDNYLPFEMIVFMAGAPDLNGDWFDAQGNPMNGWFDPATMNSGSFIYSIDTVPGCDPVFAVMTIDENITPDAGEDASILVCAGGSSFNMIDYLNGTPQTGGQWFNASNNPVPAIFNPVTMPAGTYRYHVDAHVPCVDQNSYLTITFANDNPSGLSTSYSVCENSGIINMFFALDGNPLPGGTWTNSNGAVVDNIFNPMNEPEGIYTYQYPSVGCPTPNAQLTIDIELLPEAGADVAASFCETQGTFNLSDLLVGEDAGGVWTNDLNAIVSPQQTIGSVGSFSYTYNVPGNICPDDEAVVTVQVEAASPVPGNTAFTICEDAAVVDLNDLYSLNGLIFQNQLGEVVSNLFDPSANGSSILNVISVSPNSCPDAVSQIEITVENYAFTSSTGNLDVCSSDLIYDLNASNPAIDFSSGMWTDDTGTQINNLVDLNFTGQATFTFTSAGQQMCAASEWILTLNVFEPVNAGSDTSVVFCSTDEVAALTTLLPSSNSGNGQWLFNGLPFASSYYDPQTDSPGVYLYMVEANGPCSADYAQLDVVVQDGIPYSAGLDIQQCTPAVAVQLGQDIPTGCTFQWLPAQNLDDASSALPLLYLENNMGVPVDYEFTVEVSDGICTAHDTVVVSLFPLPTPALNDTYEICEEEMLTLNSASADACVWTPQNLFPEQTASVQVISPDNDTDIHLQLTNEWNCIAFDTAHIEVHPLPMPLLIADNVAACPPVVVAFYLDEESTNCDNVQWDLGDLGIYTGNEIELSVTESGVNQMTVSISSDYGCQVVLNPQTEINIFPTPAAAFSWEPAQLTTLDATAYFQNESDGADQYSWNFAGLASDSVESPVFEFPQEEPGLFQVCLMATNSYGCIDSTCHFILLENEYNFYAPNSFTPDNDGINDYFLPVLQGFDITTYSLEIFDRWGDLIFSSIDAEQPWIGNVKGGSYYAQPDVYVWQVKVKEKEMADYRIFKGHITLIR